MKEPLIARLLHVALKIITWYLITFYLHGHQRVILLVFIAPKKRWDSY